MVVCSSLFVLSTLYLMVYYAGYCQAKALHTTAGPMDEPVIDINSQKSISDRFKVLSEFTEPTKLFLKPGQSHVLTCSTFVNLNITLIWLKDDIEIMRVSGQKSIIYSLEHAEQVDNGCYSCVALFEGKLGTSTEEGVYKDVKDVYITVITKPTLEVNQIHNDIYYDIGQNESIELSCLAFSFIDLSYEWFGYDHSNVEGVRQPTLILSNLTTPINHTYHCVVSSKVGKIVKWFRLIPRVKLNPPHIVSTQFGENHVIINVLTKRINEYVGQQITYLAACDSSAEDSYSIDSTQIMIPYSPTTESEYVECSIRLASNSKMYSDPAHIELEPQKKDKMPIEGNLYLKSIPSTGRIQFTYWLSEKVRRRLQKNRSKVYLSVREHNDKRNETLVSIDHINQFENVAEVEIFKLNTNYTVTLVEKPKQISTLTLAMPITVFMPSDQNLIVNQHKFYPEIREIIFTSHLSMMMKVYFYEKDPIFRVMLCDCCAHCETVLYEIIEKFPQSNIITLYLNTLRAHYDYVVKVISSPQQTNSWLTSHTKTFTSPKEIIPMPKNVEIKLTDSSINVSFEISSATRNMVGTVVLVQYSDISLKYYVPISSLETSIPLRIGHIIFNIRVYHFNTEDAGESYVKYVYSEAIEKNPKIIVYSALFMVVAGILLIILAIFFYYGCKDPYKNMRFKPHDSLECSNQKLIPEQPRLKSNQPSPHPTLPSTPAASKLLFTQTSVNVNEFEFELHNFAAKLNSLHKARNQLAIHEYKALKKLTKSVRKPSPSGATLDTRTFQPDPSARYVLINSPKVDQNIQFWTTLQELAPSLVVSLDSQQFNNKHYWAELANYKDETPPSIDANVKKHYYGCIHREIKFLNNGTINEFEFNHVEYLDWPINSNSPSCYGSYSQLQKLILTYLLNYPKKPIVLHCKNGIEKCGATVALNYFIKQYNNTDEINIIKSLAEYTNWNNFHLISDWGYLMSVYCGCYELLAFSNFNLKVNNYNRSLYETECENTYSHLNVSFSKKIATKLCNCSMNNNKQYLPFDKNIPSVVASSNAQPLYINASWIRNNNYHIHDYIITQNPNKKTLESFLNLLSQHHCSLIINANNLAISGSSSPIPSLYIPIDEDIEADNLKIHTLNSTIPNINCHMKFCTLRQYNCELATLQSDSKQQTTIISIHTTPNQITPSEDIAAVCRLVLRMILGRRKLLSGPIVVHCVDGGQISGILVACCVLVEQFVNFGFTNIPSIVRNLLRQRAQLITTEEQYKFVFNVVKHFIRNYIKSPHSQPLSHSSQPYGKF